MLVSALVVGGVASVRVLQRSQAAQWTDDVLSRADRALIAFAAQHHRLPCPDVDGDGLEDVDGSSTACTGADQKGWLPARTLGLDGAGTVRGRMPRLVYLVQRQAQDLARADASRYNPPAFDNDATPPGYSGVRALNQLSTADLCQGIEVARGRPVDANQARAGGRAVAYALVHPGAIQDGDSLGFDGLNGLAASATQVEAPERGWTPGVYDDRVRVQTYAGLSNALDCPRLLSSERNLAFATEWVDEVNEQKTSTMRSAIIDTTINGIKAGIAGVKTGLAVNGTLNAVTHLTAATTALTAAAASIVGLALVPTLAAAVAAAIAAIAAYATTIALAATSLASSLVAMGLSMAVAIQAGAEVNADFNLNQVRTLAQTAYDGAVVRRVQAQTRRDQAVAERDNTAWPAYNAAVSDLNAKVSAFATYVNGLNDCDRDSHPTDYDCSPTLSLSTYQPQINAVIAAVDDLVDKELAYQNAEAAYKRAINDPNHPKPAAAANSPLPPDVRQKLVDARDAAAAAGDTEKVTGLNKAIEYLDNQQTQAATYTDSQRATDLTAQINQVQAQIDGYTTRINDLSAVIGGASCDPLPTDPTVVQACVQRTQAQALKASLQDQLANLTLSVPAAQALRDAALTARDNAKNALESAKSSLRNSLNHMQYTTCTRGVTPGTGGAPDTPWSNCTVRYYASVDNDSSVSEDIAGTTYPDYKDYDLKVDRVTGTRYGYAVAIQKAEKTQKALEKATQDEADALSTVQALSGASAGGIAVWSGAAQILERADRKGGVR
jgi:hypothetical protein